VIDEWKQSGDTIAEFSRKRGLVPEPCWLPCASERERGGVGAQAAPPATSFVLQLGMRLPSITRMLAVAPWRSR
jgi:hypothetical protein